MFTLLIGTLRFKDEDDNARTRRRFDCPFLAQILRKFLTRTIIFLFVCLDLFRHDNISAKPLTKMTTVSRFSRQNDAGLRELNVVL